MTLWKRCLPMAGVWALQILYLPLNRNLTGGVLLKTPLDDYLPLWSIWVVPYALTWFIWLGSAVYMAWKMEPRLYAALLLSLFIVITCGLTWFLLYPTYIQRPELVGEGWAVTVLRAIYNADRAYNAFPSGHVYLTAVLALYWVRWFPRQRGFWIVMVTLIALSTLFTGQHYILDPLGGLALAWAGYRFGLWAVEVWGDSAHDLPLPRTH